MPSTCDRIILNPEIRSGKPTILGTRITVTDILYYKKEVLPESPLPETITHRKDSAEQENFDKPTEELPLNFNVGRPIYWDFFSEVTSF